MGKAKVIFDLSATFHPPFSFLCPPFAKENLKLADHFPLENT